MIHIPDEHLLRQQVLALPEYHINICLGSDYMGEDKKGYSNKDTGKAVRHPWKPRLAAPILKSEQFGTVLTVSFASCVCGSHGAFIVV